MARIFEINEISAKNPLRCIKPIHQWTGKGYIRVTLEWARVGLTRPREFMTERNWINGVFKSGAEKGLSRKALIDSVPDVLPYRSKSQIEDLMEKIHIDYAEIKEFDDCTVVVIKK